ncbi:hypothetical protein DITRI_Ditri09bG0014700 [Diplodiscus trichospermus]
MNKKMALNWDDCGNSWSFLSCNWDVEKPHFSGSGKSDSKGFSEAVNDDIVDRLPADPFGMEIRSTFAAAITGLIEGFENDFGSDFCVNLLCNGSMGGSFETNQISTPDDDFNGFGIGNGPLNGGFIFNDEGSGLEDCEGVFCDDSEGAAPNDALFLAVGYLGVKDLLAVERVCRSLRDAVRSDPLLWRRIHIEHSLNQRITDDPLLKLTSRAQGTLECLSLVGCVKITDDGLKRVLESNPRLTKLSVPECTRLSVEGILSNLRAFRSAGCPGIKYLRIGGSFGVTEEQFKELKFLLGADDPMQVGAQKPKFFRDGELHLMCDDDRAIDIEVCPGCQKLKLVYDCPSESCRRTHHASQLCRACILCITRCIRCGCCFKDCDYVETFTLDCLCLNCWEPIFDCDKKPELMDASSSKHTVTSYQIYFCG